MQQDIAGKQVHLGLVVKLQAVDDVGRSLVVALIDAQPCFGHDNIGVGRVEAAGEADSLVGIVVALFLHIPVNDVEHVVGIKVGFLAR